MTMSKHQATGTVNVKDKSIVAIFDTHADAQIAIDRLMAAGIDGSQVTLLSSETTARDAFGFKPKSHVGEGAAIGAGMGGGLAALVAGFVAAGAIATGGGLLIAGPLVAALAGAGAGAAGGGLIGAAVGLGIPETEVKHYEDVIKDGGVMIAVHTHTDQQYKMAKDLLKDKALNASRVR